MASLPAIILVGYGDGEMEEDRYIDHAISALPLRLLPLVAAGM
jgi:hypothetical protein